MMAWLAIVVALAAAMLLKVDAWDYLIFVREWEPSLCISRQCVFTPQNRFNIHGLWPENNDGNYPEYCNNDPFSLDDIPDIIDRMRADWPSEYGKNFAFWNHEWQAHGTCAENVFGSPHDYFAAVLDLFDRLDLQGPVSNLTLDTDYSQTDLENTLSLATGAQVRLHCKDDYVTELWTCVDQSLQLIDCPVNIAEVCSSIQLPSASSGGARGIVGRARAFWQNAVRAMWTR